MKPSLQFRLSQHLALTPQLQQSIRLLQLSTLELHQEIEQMLEQNPFLEPEDDFSPIETAASLEFERQRNEHNSSEDAGAERESSPAEADTSGIDTAEMGTTERDDWENGTERDDFDGISESPARQSQGDDELDPLERNSLSITLQEHLRQQLLGTRLSAEDMAAVDMLIESLNEDGYLADTLEDIAASLLPDDPDEDTLDELLSRLRCALGWLQNLEPVGVGARNLSECLLLQLRGRPAEPACDVAKVICREHLELLARRDFKKLMAATGADEALLKDAQSLIVSLEPKPGRAFTRAEANIIIPDVIVQKAGRSWKVILNPDVMPKLRINDYYAQALRSSRGPRGGTASEGHANLNARLQEARWFVKNIMQRFDTILRVSQAIVDQQRQFFDHGDVAMRPLTLREIADQLELHESTVSRVTTQKYMATPRGVFELKYFFGSHVATDTGGAASSTAIRALIRQLVDAEDSKKPLSDAKIAEVLGQQGIVVARRTIAKYRESLNIPPVSLRKSI